ncbi:MAG: AFG1/ZapE family ATPase [Candidatus Thiodiazotropha endolucinida]
MSPIINGGITEGLPERLYAGTRLAFEFNRTASRLKEMQSAAYLETPHIG